MTPRTTASGTRSNEAINQYAGTLEELKAQIIDGTIEVPTTPGG